MRVFALILLFVLSKLNVVAQVERPAIGKCDGKVVSTIELKLIDPGEDLIYKFLSTFAEECHANIEYTEYSNTMLFLVLEKHPEHFINAMERGSLEEDYILQQLSEPLVYEDIMGLIKKVSGIQKKSEMKKKIIAALNNANP